MKLIHGLVKNHPVKEEIAAKLKPATMKIQKQVLITQLLHPSISKNHDKGVSPTSGSGSFDPNLNTMVVDEMQFDECDDEELCQELNTVEEQLGFANKKPEVYSNTKVQDTISKYMVKIHQPSKPSNKWLQDLERDFQYIEREIEEEESFLLAQLAKGEEENFRLAQLAKVEEGREIKEEEKLVEASCEHEKGHIEHLELCETFDMPKM